MCKEQRRDRKQDKNNLGSFVSGIASYKYGMDMAKFLRALEVELKDLGVKKRNWKRVFVRPGRDVKIESERGRQEREER